VLRRSKNEALARRVTIDESVVKAPQKAAAETTKTEPKKTPPVVERTAKPAARRQIEESALPETTDVKSHAKGDAILEKASLKESTSDVRIQVALLAARRLGGE
jgi:hypothetical protein